MNEIISVERYRYNGKEYNTLNQVKTAVEDQLGAIIDRMGNTVVLPTKDKIALFKEIVKEKENLIAVLSVVYDFSDDALYSDIKNILDF